MDVLNRTIVTATSLTEAKRIRARGHQKYGVHHWTKGFHCTPEVGDAALIASIGGEALKTHLLSTRGGALPISPDEGEPVMWNRQSGSYIRILQQRQHRNGGWNESSGYEFQRDNGFRERHCREGNRARRSRPRARKRFGRRRTARHRITQEWVRSNNELEILAKQG